MEIWKPVPEYDGIYEVSNYGQVKSLERDVRKGNIIQHRKERIKRQWTNDDGYKVCKLSKDGTDVLIGVHRVVALAFLNNDLHKPEVNHKDGNRINNCVENLEWVTHDENIQDSIQRGTHVSLRDWSGESNPNYGNRKLHAKYKEHPELAVAAQSRRGSQNGRAKPVRAYMPDGTIKDFGYIGECSNWLIDNHLVKVKVERMNLVIKRCASNGDLYHGIRFEFL